MQVSRFFPITVLACVTFFVGTAGAAQSTTDPYAIVRIADGVYGFVWADQSGPEPNMLIVINDEDVLLVDSSMYPSDARAVVSEIRKLTPKPVRYLVNTHWHDDHLFGNSVIQETWPDVRIIAHANTRIDATSKAFGSTPKVLADRTALIEKYRTMLKTNTGPDGQPLIEERRKRVEAIAAYSKYSKK